MSRKYYLLNHLFNFIAVILGVYLAFYINERAKINHDRTESRLLLNSLINDLLDDIKVYEEYQIPENNQHQKSVEDVLELLVTGDLKEVNARLPALLQIENFAPTTSTYSSMKASGKIGLIDNLTLQKELSDYYEGLVLETVKKGEFQVTYFTEELLPWLTRNVDLLAMELQNKDELFVLRNELVIYQSLIGQKVESYEMIVEKSKKLISQIEAVIETK